MDFLSTAMRGRLITVASCSFFILGSGDFLEFSFCVLKRILLFFFSISKCFVEVGRVYLLAFQDT